MVKLRRGAQTALSDDKSLRLRAAWLYHAHGLTQNEVATQLGLGRTTVIRLLDEAKQRGEVRVWIDEGVAELVELGIEIEQALGLDEVIVVPSGGDQATTAQSVGLALGKFLSEAITDDMTIGVGWGRTLTASLESFHPPRHSGVKVMSLLGGAIETRFANPVEFTWRLAGALNAECYLFPAPLIVDSAKTKRHLIEDCGLDRLYTLAQSIDLAIISAGDINQNSTSLVRHLISDKEHKELVAQGCVADLLCNFMDENGDPVRHPINDRIMSIDLDRLRKAAHIVLASGGAVRAQAIIAAIRGVGCNTLVTDEAAARPLLSLAKTKPPRREDNAPAKAPARRSHS